MDVICPFYEYFLELVLGDLAVAVEVELVEELADVLCGLLGQEALDLLDVDEARVVLRYWRRTVSKKEKASSSRAVRSSRSSELAATRNSV